MASVEVSHGDCDDESSNSCASENEGGGDVDRHTPVKTRQADSEAESVGDEEESGEDEAESGGDEQSQTEAKSSGLADVFRKLLKKSVGKRKNPVLSKGKTDKEIKRQKLTKTKEGEETEGADNSCDDDDSKTRRLDFQKKKEWEEMGRVKPNVLERERERMLQRIATRVRCCLSQKVGANSNNLLSDIREGRCDAVIEQVRADKALLQQTEKDRALFAACSSSCDRCAEAVLQAGADTEARDHEYLTPLIRACQQGAVKVVRLLVEWDCQVSNPGGPQSNTALHVAAAEGYLDCCQVLVNARAAVNAQNAHDDTPLILASLHGHLPIVRFLLQHNASIRKRGNHERTALHCAAEGGHLSLCRYLVSANADLEEEDTFGNTPLICAAEKGVAELLSLLLSHGCDVNRMSHSGATALHYAAQHGALQCCKVLLESNAEIDAQDIRRFTPLMMSALNGHYEVVRLLLEWKGNVNMAAYNRRTALHLAAERGKLDCCILLLDAGAAIDAQDASGISPLHVAAMKGQIQVVQYLMSCGADIKRRPFNGNSLMHMAASSGSEQCCQMLLKQGFNIDEQNNDGNTPLFCAVHTKQARTVKFLLQAGCSVDIRGSHGMTALNEAAFIGHFDILKMLLLHGANSAIPDDVGTLPLWFAIVNQTYDCIRLLLLARSPVLLRSTLNPAVGPCNPVEYAAQKQRDVIVDWLLAAGGEDVANCLRSYFPTLEKNAAVRPPYHQRLRALVSQPQSLLRQCRCSIRKVIQRNAGCIVSLTEDFSDFALPQMLKVYLSLGDLVAPECKAGDVTST